MNILFGPANDYDNMLMGANLCNALADANPEEECTQILATEGLTGFATKYFPRTPQITARFYAWKPGFFVCAMEGTNTVSQGTGLVAGYGVNTLEVTPYGMNSYLAAAVRSMIVELNDLGVDYRSNCSLYGHSLGGAIVLGLHYLLRLQFGSTFIQTATYGAPRTGTDVFTQQMNRMNVVRLMNAEDPVPLVPPNSGQAPLVRYLQSQETLVYWSQFDHCAGGAVLNLTGDIIESHLPTVAMINPTTSLAAWLASLPLGIYTVHSLPTYIARLQLYRTKTMPSAPPPALSPTPERNHTQTAAAAGAEIRQIAGNVAQVAYDQRAQPVSVQPAFLFHTFRQGKAWAVSFMGEPVALGPTKREARKLARAGNAMVRAMLHQGAVDQSAILSQWELFMNLAASGTAGIQPAMSVE